MPKLADARQLNQMIERLASEIARDAPRDCPVGIVGIRRRGEYMARRMMPLLEKAGVPQLLHGALDITLYRDDLTTIGPNAVLRGTEIEFDVTGAWLVLVDDVLYTGRSVRAALDALVDLGRPRAIKLAVLVDRGWRELPIQGDYVGMKQETGPHNIIKVKLSEVDGVDEVEMVP